MIEKKLIEEMVKRMNIVAEWHKLPYTFKYVEEQYELDGAFHCVGMLETTEPLILIKADTSTIMYSRKMVVEETRLKVLESMCLMSVFGQGNLVETMRGLKRGLHGTMGKGTTGEAG